MIETTYLPAQTGDVWHVPEHIPHPTLERLLKARDHLIVLTHSQAPYQVVLGVPHQVPSGRWRICEERLDESGNLNPRKGDDNVASVALVAFSQLVKLNIPCKLVIMVRAMTQDPNKVLDSPYCQEIFRDETQLLFECHASSGSRLLDLELSAGSNRITQTIRFGQTLATLLDYRYILGVQTYPGQAEAIIFQDSGVTLSGHLQLPATKTTSLIAAERYDIPALHLETKPRFRVSRNMPNSVSPDGAILGRTVAKTIARMVGRIKLM